jgi:hypothetical protein
MFAMSVETIKTEVQQLLAQADEKLRRAQRRYDQGSDAEKVTAAGQLVFLRRQKEALDGRMADLDRVKDGGGATTQWFKEDWMLLMQRLDAFMEGR